MQTPGPEKPAEEALKPLQDKSLLGPEEEEGEEEDLLQREEDYGLPSSESHEDQDCVPPFAKGPGPSRAPQTTTTSGRAAPPPTAPGCGHTQLLAPPTQRKRGRSSSASDEEEDDEEEEEEDDDDEEDSDEEEDDDDSDEEEEEDDDEDDCDGGWHGREEASITPAPLRFLPARPPGPTCDSSTAWTPLSLFQLFFSDSVVQQIVDNTNANAAKRQRAWTLFDWKTLSMKEFYTFLNIVIFTSLMPPAHRNVCWRKEWPYNSNLHAPTDLMAQRRFEEILRILHLSDPEEDEENEQKRDTAEHDLLFQIKPLYTQMVDACKANFQPHQNLSVDEQMVISKAHNMKRDLDTPTKRGYKLLVLADSSTGYTWNFSVSCKGESSTDRGRRSSAVMDLLPFPLLGDGYVLYTDSSYSSPALFADLSKKNMGCCGTLKRNVPGFPKTRTNDLPREPERGDMRWLQRGDLLFVKWMDLREVSMCSTVHQAYSGQTADMEVKAAGKWQIKAVPVPDIAVDFNHNMGDDLSDEVFGNYNFHNKNLEWFKPLFYRFVDIAVVNSFLLHEELTKLRTDTKTLAHKAFREQLLSEMLEYAERTFFGFTNFVRLPMSFDSEEAIRKYCWNPMTNEGPECED